MRNFLILRAWTPVDAPIGGPGCWVAKTDGTFYYDTTAGRLTRLVASKRDIAIQKAVELLWPEPRHGISEDQRTAQLAREQAWSSDLLVTIH